jgi:hypothetical protein
MALPKPPGAKPCVRKALEVISISHVSTADQASTAMSVIMVRSLRVR